MDKLEVWPKTKQELDVLLSSKKNTRTFHPLYSTYWNMRGRCYNKNIESYPRYGGKGIRVCERWLKDFWYFIYDMGEKPDGYSIDRINSKGNYTPNNCRWASLFVQNNNKSDNFMITAHGKTMTAAQWSKKTNIPRDTIISRIKVHGIEPEEALSCLNRLETYLEFGGKKMSIKEWSEHLGINKKTISSRLNRGYPIEYVLRKGKIPRNTIHALPEGQ